MKGYFKIKRPEIKRLSDSRLKLKKMADEEWKKHIFYYLLKFYKKIDKNEIIALIIKEKRKERSKIEDKIKKRIRKWLKTDIEFKASDFLVDRESMSEGRIDGKYDLKIMHGQWRDSDMRDKYFAFECKNLDASSDSVNEYVYKKSKKDGGMYRYMINKYACDLNFGGMIGFVIKGRQTSIKESIIEKIYTVFTKSDLEGQLTGDSIIRKSIEDNSNTFDSIHLRPLLNKNRKQQIFTLHHILMDFSENSVYKKCDKTIEK